MTLLNQYYSALYHWNQIIDEVRAGGELSGGNFTVGYIPYGVSGCDYCFTHRDCSGCGVCPIAVKTGLDCCDGTSWLAFHEAVKHHSRGIALVLAVRMRDFIIFSRPEEARQ